MYTHLEILVLPHLSIQSTLSRGGRSSVYSATMQSTPRPLPGAPPLRLPSAYLADTRSYRPLPIPPVQSADISSIDSLYLHTPPTLTSSFPGSSKSLVRPRPKLHILVKSPIRRRRTSLDSLTVRTPAFRDPGQTLVPAVDRWDNPVISDRSWSRRAPHNPERSSRVSSVKSSDSPLVFKSRTVPIEPCIQESEEDGGKSRLAQVSSVPSLTHTIRTWSGPPHLVAGEGRL